MVLFGGLAGQSNPTDWRLAGVTNYDDGIGQRGLEKGNGARINHSWSS